MQLTETGYRSRAAMTRDILLVLKEEGPKNYTNIFGITRLNGKTCKEIILGLQLRGFVSLLPEFRNRYSITEKGKRFLDSLNSVVEEEKKLVG